MGDDPELDEVMAHLARRFRGNAETFFVDLVRRAIDEVLDGPRTGRCDFDELAKTEKTYVGTKVEILFGAALELDRGRHMDFEVAGHDVDIKWAFASGWAIPREAVGELCLCIGGRKKLTRLQVGVVRCTAERLNAGANQDGKKSLSSDGRDAMRMLVEDAAFPANFVARLPADVRAYIVGRKSIQERIAALAKARPYVPIPRDAICTVARTTGDPMRRIRQDAGRPDPLDGMVMLTAKYGNAKIEALGYPRLGKDEVMAVPRTDLEAAGLDD